MDWRDAEREFDHPALDDDTLPRAFEASADRHADQVAQRYKGSVYDRSLVDADVIPAALDGDYADLTYAEMRDVVRNLAAGFRELGVEAGTRVAIFAQTRMEWAQADFAALAAGGVVTTVYPSASDRQLTYLLEDPEATVVIAENRELVERTLAVADDLGHNLDAVVCMDRVEGDDDWEDEKREDDGRKADDRGDHGGVEVLTLGEVHERGADVFDPDAYESWLAERNTEDLASLIYTSGTTGRPKGVELTHANFRANLNQCFRRLGPRPDRGDDLTVVDETATTVSFLPLAHVFERLVGHYQMFAAGATVAYAESAETLKEDFTLARPTVTTSVPRVYEKLYDSIREQASESPIKERIFEWAVDVGRAYYAADDPGVALEFKRELADKLVFSTVREAVGGNFDFFISGGGSLSPELCALFHGMGLPILEGYGLTETSPVVSVNPPERPVVGTIGPPVADTEIEIDESVVTEAFRSDAGEVGELLVKGPQVTDGYWNRPEATAETFTEEDPASDASGESDERRSSGRWFRTGDVVELREDGYIEFEERAKQLLVLSTGKNVAPGPIEDAFASSEFVEQCLVLGDSRKFVSALVVPTVAAVEAWADKQGVNLPDDREAICRHEQVRERIEREVETINRRFDEYEQIKQFRLVPEAFTEENDLLTPTLKKKRRNILDRFSEDVELIYEGSDADES